MGFSEKVFLLREGVNPLLTPPRRQGLFIVTREKKEGKREDKKDKEDKENKEEGGVWN